MRIPAKPLSDYPLWIRPFFWNQRRKYGAVLDPGLLWARSPRLFAGVAILYGMIDRRSSPIDPVLRALVTVLVSQINRCSFCIDINSATLRHHGVPEEKATALPDWRTSPLFGPAERAALDYADAVTRHDRGVDDRLFAELRRHFDDDAIVELTGIVAFQNLSSKFNSALDVPAQGFCPAPPDDGSGRPEP